jgi:hypothetical protein
MRPSRRCLEGRMTTSEDESCVLNPGHVISWIDVSLLHFLMLMQKSGVESQSVPARSREQGLGSCGGWCKYPDNTLPALTTMRNVQQLP